MLDEVSLDAKISSLLAILFKTVENDNSMGYTTLNKKIQLLYAFLLNIIYDYQLIDLDREKRGILFTGIDLGDNVKGVCYQVTSDNSLEKIKETINKYNNKKYYNDYPVLNHIIIGTKKNYTGTVTKM